MSYTTEDIILKTLCRKSPAGEDEIDELIDITKKYPAFGAAKYFAAKKMKQAQHEGFEKYAQNAILYFTNPFWFHFKLNEEELMLNDAFLAKKETSKNTETERGSIQTAINATDFAVAEKQPSEEDTTEHAEEAAAQPVAIETVAEEAPPTEFIEIVPEANGEALLMEEPADRELPLEADVMEKKEEHAIVQAETPLPEQPEETEATVETALKVTKEEHPSEDSETLLPEQPAEPEQMVETVLAATIEEHAIEHSHAMLPEQLPEPGAVVEEIATEAKEEHPAEQLETLLQQQPTEDDVPLETVVYHAKEEQPAEPGAVVENAFTEAKEEHVAEHAETLLVEKPVEQNEIIEVALAGDVHTTEQKEPALPADLDTNKPAAEARPEEYSPKFAHFEWVGSADDRGGEEPDDADTATGAMMPPLSSDRISSVLQGQLADFKKPVADGTPVPVETEPYHTIDYFASQGIKLTVEQQSQDHLSVKVKKFTDWLKQMKRINPAPVDLGIDEAAEHRVQNIAAGSNEPKEVVTEAMAEVLAKQGMTEKAIQVYTKLSFLYPSKSAYFASQIEQLKGI